MAKILVADDVKTESLMVTKMLNSAGHSVINAVDGEEALAMAKREKPDLILLDIVMPKMDGFQVCRKIKRGADTKEIKVVLLSSKTQESDKFWGMKQGASDYLFKPVDEEKLLSAVKAHL